MARQPLPVPDFVAPLMSALRLGVPDAEVTCEFVRGRRYRFVVVSAAFDGMGHPERQELVWEIAARVVGKADILNVGMILTLGHEDLNDETYARFRPRGVGCRTSEEPRAMAAAWDNAFLPDRYKPGAVVTGRVSEIHPFGAFLELEPRVFGLLMITEISERRVRHPDEVLSVGQKLRVKVLVADPEQKKISVSLKQVGPAEEPVAGEGFHIESERIDGEPGFMTADRLRACLAASPFRPFSIVSVNGRSCHVPAPEFALLPPGREQTIIVSKPRDGFEIISIRWITGIHFGSTGLAGDAPNLELRPDPAV